MHIGVTSSEVIRGGLNSYVTALCEAQLTAGLAVEALLVGDVTEPYQRKVASLNERPLHRLLAFRKQMLHRLNVDIIDSHFAWHVLPGLIPPVGRRGRPPLVMHFHGPWADESRAVGAPRYSVAIKKVVERFAYRRADLIITLSDHFATRLCRDYGVTMDKIRVERPGVDTNAFYPVLPAEARHRLGIAADKRWLVTARRLVPRMGILDLIEALPRLPADVALMIVGTGAQRSDLEDAVQRLGLRERVVFLGAVTANQLRDAYAAAEISVIPTKELEGFGLVALESLACGTPVVARPQGGLVEALYGLGHLCLVDDMSEPALLGKIQAALDGQVPSKDAMLEHVDRFTWATCVSRLNLIYQEAIDHHRARQQAIHVCASRARLRKGR